MKDHSLLWILAFIIILGVVVGIATNGKRPENLYNNINTEKTNSIENKVDDKNNKTQNEAIENKEAENKENTAVENTENESGKSTETFSGTPKTDKEKAIDIVKKDYGDKSGIEYSAEGIDEKGRQIIVVRNAKTTEAYAFYFVDVDNKTFVKQ